MMQLTQSFVTGHLFVHIIFALILFVFARYQLCRTKSGKFRSSQCCHFVLQIGTYIHQSIPYHPIVYLGRSMKRRCHQQLRWRIGERCWRRQFRIAQQIITAAYRYNRCIIVVDSSGRTIRLDRFITSSSRRIRSIRVVVRSCSCCWRRRRC